MIITHGKKNGISFEKMPTIQLRYECARRRIGTLEWRANAPREALIRGLYGVLKIEGKGDTLSESRGVL